jgi:hypothetical protein
VGIVDVGIVEVGIVEVGIKVDEAGVVLKVVVGI